MRMKPAEKIIAAFGGINPMRRALGHKNASTVQGWKERGFIPARQQGAVLAKARELNIEILESDFFEDVPVTPGPTFDDRVAARVRATAPHLVESEVRPLQSRRTTRPVLVSRQEKGGDR